MPIAASAGRTCLHRNLGAGADGHPHVCLRQRRRVVDAIAYHRHHARLATSPPLPLQMRNVGRLAGRRHVGKHLLGIDSALPSRPNTVPPPRHFGIRGAGVVRQRMSTVTNAA